jgi:palmitoyl-protein thioesterase
MRLNIVNLLAVVALAGSTVSLAAPSPKPAPRPVVIWHGMGDSADSEGMQSVAQTIVDIAGPRYMVSVSLGEDDQRATFFGDVDAQVDAVCQLLSEDDDLAGGFDAIGFSQGGQFLRAYVERCNVPPIKKLITFGSQHMGVAALPGCPEGENSITCSIAREIASRAVYSEFVQSRVVQAQYFRDVARLEEYLEAVRFLPDINNERDRKTPAYKSNLASLEKLALVLFTEDVTVIPKETAWFGYYADADAAAENNVTEMRGLPIYKDDWIGLKGLDKVGKIDFLECEGAHMQIPEEFLEDVVKKYIGDKGTKGEEKAVLVKKVVKLAEVEKSERDVVKIQA